MDDTGSSLKRLQILAEENDTGEIQQIIQSVEKELEIMSGLLTDFVNS